MRKSKRMTKKQIREKRKIAREIKQTLMELSWNDIQARQANSVHEIMRLNEKRHKLKEILETFKK